MKHLRFNQDFLHGNASIHHLSHFVVVVDALFSTNNDRDNATTTRRGGSCSWPARASYHLPVARVARGKSALLAATKVAVTQLQPHESAEAETRIVAASLFKNCRAIVDAFHEVDLPPTPKYSPFRGPRVIRSVGLMLTSPLIVCPARDRRACHSTATSPDIRCLATIDRDSRPEAILGR